MSAVYLDKAKLKLVWKLGTETETKLRVKKVKSKEVWAALWAARFNCKLI